MLHYFNLAYDIEQPYDASLRDLKDSPRKSRINSRRFLEADISVSEAQDWKARKKNGSKASPLFDEPSLRLLSERDHVSVKLGYPVTKRY